MKGNRKRERERMGDMVRGREWEIEGGKWRENEKEREKERDKLTTRKREREREREREE